MLILMFNFGMPFKCLFVLILFLKYSLSVIVHSTSLFHDILLLLLEQLGFLSLENDSHFRFMSFLSLQCCYFAPPSLYFL